MISAKHSPPCLPGTVPRTRLFAACDRALADAPVLWIEAPAGAGKTRLAASYLESASRPTRWLNADPGDRDPVAFFATLAAHASDAALPDLATERALDLENFGRRFFRHWFAAVPPGTVLVLDDWHVTLGSPIEALLPALADQVPAGSHVIVLSREGPGPALARLELNDRLRRLQSDTLAFTSDEARDLASHLGLVLSEATLTQIVPATGGWAIGVQLLMRGYLGSARQPVSPTVLGAYVEQELLAPLNEAERGILLSASLLDTFDGALVAAVSGQPDTMRVLEALSQRTGLVAPVGADSNVFHCPALFRDVLRDRARHLMPPSAYAALVGRCADHLVGEDRAAAAFELLRQTAEPGVLPTFVERHGESLVVTGRTETLRGWLDALPPDAFEASPRLRLWRGLCRSFLAPREALDDIAEAYRRFTAANDTGGAFSAAVAAVESGLAQVHDLPALDPWIEALAATIDAAATDAERLRGWYALVYAAQCRNPGQPRVSEGVAWLRAYARRTQDPSERLICGVALVFHACVAADHVLGQEIIDLVAPRLTDDMPSPVTRWLWHYWRGLYHLWRIEYVDATREWDVSVQLCETHGLKALEYVILANVVMVDLAEDRLTDARRHLDIIDAAFTGTESMARAFFWLGEMFYRFAVKDHASTREATDHFLQTARRAGLFSLEMLALTDVAALRLIDGDADGAAILVAEARARTTGTVTRHCEGQITGIEAAVAYVRGDRDSARTLFSRTLDLVGHKGTCGCLLWVRSGLSILFSEAWQAGERPDLIRELIRRHQIPAPTSFTRPWPWPVQIRAFGPLEIRIDDRLLLPDGKSQHRVLDFLRVLIAEGGQDVRAERVADVLWPDSEGDAAMTNVRGTVKRLRELLGHAETVRVFDGKIGLNTRLVWLDLWALRELVDALDEGRPIIDASGSRADALLFDLYRAPLFEAEPGGWLDNARQRARRQFARAVSVLVRRARQTGDETAAADLLERAMVRDPGLRGVEGIGPREVGGPTGLQRWGS